MAILVTGGAGYIGSHTCVELQNAGRNAARCHRRRSTLQQPTQRAAQEGKAETKHFNRR